MKLANIIIGKIKIMKIIENYGFIKYLKIEFQNLFRNIIYKYRLKRAIKYWNKNLNFINRCIQYNKEKENYSFKWTQLIYQEGFMYCRIGKQVDRNELLELSKRRGFTEEMLCFLVNWVKYIGLGEKSMI